MWPPVATTIFLIGSLYKSFSAPILVIIASCEFVYNYVIFFLIKYPGLAGVNFAD